MRRAFAPLAVVIALLGAGCEQASSPKPVPYAGVPLPVPPPPPRVPPRPRPAAADAAQAEADAEPEMDTAAATPLVEAEPGPPDAAGGLPQLQAALPPSAPVLPPLPALPPPTLAALAGLNEGEVLRRFGGPSRAAVVGQGMRWTWEAEGCEMTMTLFPDVAAQMRRVLSAELSGAGRDELGEAGCLNRLGRQRAGL